MLFARCLWLYVQNNLSNMENKLLHFCSSCFILCEEGITLEDGSDLWQSGMLYYGIPFPKYYPSAVVLHRQWFEWRSCYCYQ